MWKRGQESYRGRRSRYVANSFVPRSQGSPQAMKTLVAISLLVMLCLLDLGCATHRMYDGEARPKDQVAVIEHPTGPSGVQVTIENVDGRPHDGGHGDTDVLPGRHKVALKVLRGKMMAAQSVSFDARAGHVYRIEAAESLLCSVFDDATGNNVTLPQERAP
jgi:hypothetical protein